MQMAKVIKVMQKILQIVSLIFFVLVMVLICGNVFLRIFFDKPIQGIYELTGLCAIMFGSAAIVTCSMQDGHISVDIITSKLKGLSRLSLAYMASIVDLIYYATISACGFYYAYTKVLSGEVSDTLFIFVPPFRIWLAFCLALIILVKVYKIATTKATIESTLTNREKEVLEASEEQAQASES